MTARQIEINTYLLCIVTEIHVAISSVISPQIGSVLSVIFVHNPTRFHKNISKTFCVMLLTDGLTNWCARR